MHGKQVETTIKKPLSIFAFLYLRVKFVYSVDSNYGFVQFGYLLFFHSDNFGVWILDSMSMEHFFVPNLLLDTVRLIQNLLVCLIKHTLHYLIISIAPL